MFNFATKVTEGPVVASVVLPDMAIVFGVLILFVLIFSVFCLFNKNRKQAKTEKESVMSAPVASASVSDDEDIIAVIAAAVYSMYEGTGKKAVIRSIKPAASTGRSAWATAGLMNNIKSF